MLEPPGMHLFSENNTKDKVWCVGWLGHRKDMKHPTHRKVTPVAAARVTWLQSVSLRVADGVRRHRPGVEGLLRCLSQARGEVTPAFF